MSDFLIHIDSAKREILAADSLVKVKDLWNKADAMRALGQAAKDAELVNYATEFKLRCERRLGEMLLSLKATGDFGQGRRKVHGSMNFKDVGLSESDRNLSSRAQRIASVPEEQFEIAIAEVRQEEQQITRRAMDKLLGVATARNILRPLKEIVYQGKYRTIVIDPPWPMETIEREVRPNQIVKEYLSLPLDEIYKLPIKDLADPSGCHIYLWFTQKWRRIVFSLFDEWGVTDECFLTWVKNVGFTPYSWMYSTEHVLFGRVGNLPLLKMGKRLDFCGKVREHSRKPDEFYELVKEVSPEPRLELFSRERRDGFEQFGDQTEKFGAVSV
jgi:N6-adenosine-specific RNA methylase IME4